MVSYSCSMDMLQIISTFLEMQRAVLFDETVELNHGVLCTVSSNQTPYDNFMLLKNNLTPEVIVKYEQEFARRNRYPSFLIINSSDYELSIHLLEQLGYCEYTNDQWMFIDAAKSPLLTMFPTAKTSIRYATDLSALEDFLFVFKSSHQEDDLKNAYGAGDAFVPTIEATWKKEVSKDRCIYMVVYDDSEPAACAVAVVYRSMAYLTCVGTHPSYRRRGYASLLIGEFLRISIEKKSTTIFLTTEKNRYPFDYFSKHGFVDRFSTIGYTKKI